MWPLSLNKKCKSKLKNKLKGEEVIVSLSHNSHQYLQCPSLSFLGSSYKITNFVLQKADAPKNGIEYHQKSIGGVKYSRGTSYNYLQRNRQADGQDHILSQADALTKKENNIKQDKREKIE